jgi:A/G-specific adenine glycosylase
MRATAQAAPGFAENVVAWQQREGRHDLPWQNTRDAYAIWVSEIMLQQTQVATVIPYYLRFMRSFPHVRALAGAREEDVLVHWSGLGYYARARCLHRAALRIVEHHGGVFPTEFEAVEALPGIGRSTAGAILAFSVGGRFPILDGNVKRVLARCFGIGGYPGDVPVAAALWARAEAELPRRDIEAYTQGLMDLGARVCVRQPRCPMCPLQKTCVAYRDGTQSELPAARPKKSLPRKSTVMLVLQRAGEVLLEKRPAPGIWGGLWCFPEAEPGADHEQACEQRFGAAVTRLAALPPIQHGFTHFKLQITAQPLRVTALTPRAASPGQVWLALEEALGAAVPAPVRRILVSLLAGAGRAADAKA